MATTILKMNSDWKKIILAFLEHYLPCPSYFTDLAYKFEHFAADEPVSLRESIQDYSFTGNDVWGRDMGREENGIEKLDLAEICVDCRVINEERIRDERNKRIIEVWETSKIV